MAVRLHRRDLAVHQLENLIVREDSGIRHAESLGHDGGAVIEALCGRVTLALQTSS